MSLPQQHDRGDEAKIAHTTSADGPSMLILKNQGGMSRLVETI